jgi:hypothetical protein
MAIELGRRGTQGDAAIQRGPDGEAQHAGDNF